MKKIILLFIALNIISCTSEKIETPINTNTGNTEKIKDTKEKIIWDKNLDFSYCDSSANYLEGDNSFYEKEDVELLTKKLQILDDNPYSNTIFEYCKTTDSKKFIFSKDWGEIKVGRYDKDVDIIQKAKNISFFDDIIMVHHGSDRDYGDSSLEQKIFDYKKSKSKINGFGKKSEYIIPFSNYGFSITGNIESAPGVFTGKSQLFYKKNIKYCTNGLTKGGKLGTCFIDIFYNYDFVKNTLTQKKVCSYFIDDDGSIKTLEKCINFENKNGYILKDKTKGIEFLQDISGDISIIDVDLKDSKISFGGIIKTKEDYDVNTFQKIFKRNFIKDFYKIYQSKNPEKNIFAFVNGQFFNQKINPTLLSFPLKIDGKIINAYIDNDKKKRTFIIDKNSNAMIKNSYKKEFLENDKYNEVIVGFSPKENMISEIKTGRTYIGVKNNKSVVFFIAQNKNQAEMDEIIKNYGIEEENIIMMDGGPSSQFSWIFKKYIGNDMKQFYGKWEIPQFFIIYNDN